MNTNSCLSKTMHCVQTAPGLKKPHSLHLSRRGLTIVELMIVVGIILLLAGIAIPSIKRGREQTRIGALIDEFRLNFEAFTIYAQEKGSLPPTASGASVIPTGMNLYLPKRSSWTIDNTQSGGMTPRFPGRWYWIKIGLDSMPNASGFIMFYSPEVTPEIAKQIDQRIDDGNTSSGALRFGSASGGAAGSWLYFGVQ